MWTEAFPLRQYSKSMKTIKFTPQLSELIKTGKKVTTFRLFDDKDLQVGDEFIMATRDGEQVTEFGTGVITEVILRTIDTLQPKDYEGHEPVEDPIKYYKQFYGDRVQGDSEVKIIRFDVLSLS